MCAYPTSASQKITQQMNCLTRSSLSPLRHVMALCLALCWGIVGLAQCEDVNSNDICDEDETGCTIELACNYDPTAVFPDPTGCDFVSCLSLAAPTPTLATTTKVRPTTMGLAPMQPIPTTAMGPV